jgi:hypothetical protein
MNANHLSQSYGFGQVGAWGTRALVSPPPWGWSDKDDRKAFGIKENPDREGPKNIPKKPKIKWWIILAILGILLVLLLIVFLNLSMVGGPALFPRKVNIPSGVYLHAASLYSHSDVQYDAANPPLAAEVVQAEVNRDKGELVFTLATGETIRVTLGKASQVSRVLGCENNSSLETFQLPVEELRLGSASFQKPVLMAVCGSSGGYSGRRTIPLASFILMEGPPPTADELYLGMQSHLTKARKSISFGQAYGMLKSNFVDGKSGQPAPEAHITLTNEMGVLEYAGAFSLPLYAGVQMAFSISAPGYPDLQGMIQSTGSKLFIDFKVTETRGYGTVLDMPGYGKILEYSFSLGGPPDYLAEQPATPTAYPTAPGTATATP